MMNVRESYSPAIEQGTLGPTFHLQGVPSARRLDWFTWISSVPPMGMWQKQLGEMMEHPNQSQPNPGPQLDESPCTLKSISL